MKFIIRIGRELKKNKDQYLELLYSSYVWSDKRFIKLRNYLYEHIYKQLIIQDIIKYIYRVINWSYTRRRMSNSFYIHRRHREAKRRRIAFQLRLSIVYWRIIIFFLVLKIIFLLWDCGFIFWFTLGSIMFYFVLWANYNRIYNSLSLKGRIKKKYINNDRRIKAQSYLIKTALRSKLILSLQKKHKMLSLSKKVAKRKWFIGKTKFEEHSYISPKLLHWMDFINLLSPKTIFFFNNPNLSLKHHVSYYKKSFVIDTTAKTQEEQLLLKHYLESENKLDLFKNELLYQNVISDDGHLEIKPIYSEECLYDHRNNTQVILSCYALIFIHNDGKHDTILALGPWYTQQVSKKPWYVTIDLQVYREAIKDKYRITFDIDSHLVLNNPSKFKFGEYGTTWIKPRHKPIVWSPFVIRPYMVPSQWEKFTSTVKYHTRERKLQFLMFLLTHWLNFYENKLYTPRKREFVRFMKQLTAKRKKPMSYLRQLKIFISKIRGYWVHFNTVYISYVKRRLRWSKLRWKPLHWKHFWIRIWLNLDWWWVDFKRFWQPFIYHTLLSHIVPRWVPFFEVRLFRLVHNFNLLLNKRFLKRFFKNKLKPWLLWRLSRLIITIFKEFFRIFTSICLQLFIYLKTTIKLLLSLERLIDLKELLPKYSFPRKNKNFFFTKINIQRSVYISRSKNYFSDITRRVQYTLFPKTHSDCEFSEKHFHFNKNSHFDFIESNYNIYDKSARFATTNIGRGRYTKAFYQSITAMKQRNLLHNFVYLSELKKIHINPHPLSYLSFKSENLLQKLDFKNIKANDYIFNEIQYTLSDLVHISKDVSDDQLNRLFLYFYQTSSHSFILYTQALLDFYLTSEISEILNINRQYFNNIALSKLKKKPILIRTKKIKKLNKIQLQNLKRIKTQVSFLLLNG